MSLDGEGVVGLAVLLAGFLLIYAVIHGLQDTLGRRRGGVIAALGGVASLVAIREWLVHTTSPGWGQWVDAFGAAGWPFAVITTVAFWSLVGLAPAGFYVVRHMRRRPRSARDADAAALEPVSK